MSYALMAFGAVVVTASIGMNTAVGTSFNIGLLIDSVKWCISGCFLFVSGVILYTSRKSTKNAEAIILSIQNNSNNKSHIKENSVTNISAPIKHQNNDYRQSPGLS